MRAKRVLAAELSPRFLNSFFGQLFSDLTWPRSKLVLRRSSCACMPLLFFYYCYCYYYYYYYWKCISRPHFMHFKKVKQTIMQYSNISQRRIAKSCTGRKNHGSRSLKTIMLLIFFFSNISFSIFPSCSKSFTLFFFFFFLLTFYQYNSLLSNKVKSLFLVFGRKNKTQHGLCQRQWLRWRRCWLRIQPSCYSSCSLFYYHWHLYISTISLASLEKLSETCKCCHTWVLQGKKLFAY